MYAAFRYSITIYVETCTEKIKCYLIFELFSDLIFCFVQSLSLEFRRPIENGLSSNPVISNCCSTFLSCLKQVEKTKMKDKKVLNGTMCVRLIFSTPVTKNGTIPTSFSCIFVLFTLQLQSRFHQYKLKKAYIVCLGFEPRAAGWCAQTKPLAMAATLFL